MGKEIKVSNYGDMLSQVIGKKLISYNSFGSYQGDWIASIDNGESIELWKGYYGSCSGCDWLFAERSWEDDTVPLEKAKEFFKETKPFITIPKEMIKRIDLETFEQLLPANTRADIYDFDAKELFDNIKNGLIK